MEPNRSTMPVAWAVQKYFKWSFSSLASLYSCYLCEYSFPVQYIHIVPKSIVLWSFDLSSCGLPFVFFHCDSAILRSSGLQIRCRTPSFQWSMRPTKHFSGGIRCNHIYFLICGVIILDGTTPHTLNLLSISVSFLFFPLKSLLYSVSYLFLLTFISFFHAGS